MNYQDKTKDELIKELLSLKAENQLLSSSKNSSTHKTEDLLQSELRYERFFEDNHSVMLLINPESGNVIDANPAATHFYGWTHEELQKMLISEINTLSPEEVKVEMQKSIADKRRQFYFKHRLANGEVRDVEVYSGPIKFGDSSYLYSIVHDISETTKVNESLRISEEKYRNMFETVQDAYYEASPDGVLLDISPSINTISKGQYTREEVIGKSFVDLYTDPDARARFYTQLMSEGKVIDYELMLLNKDGSVVPVAISSSFIKDLDGNIVKITGSMRDISERKLIEKTLKESEEKYRTDLLLLNSIFESPVNIIVYSFDKNYCYSAFTKYHAQTMKKIWGIDIQVGMNMIEQMSNIEIREKYTSTFDRAFKGESFILTDEHNDEKLGRTYYESFYSPVKNSSDQITGVSVFVVDITDRMQATKRLEISEDKFRQVVEQTSDFIAIIDNEGNITYASSSAVSIFHIQPEEMVGLNFIQFVADTDIKHSGNGFRNIVENGAILKNSVSLMKRSDGKEFYGELNGSKYTSGSFNGVLVTIRDISERKAAEQEIHKFKTISDQANYGVVISSLEGIFLYVNDAFAQMVGWDAVDLLGQNSFVVHNEEQTERVAEIIALMKSNKGFISEELYHTRKDGSSFPTLMSSKVIYDKNNTAQYISATIIDISDRKLAEEMISQKSAILANLLINLKEGILLENADRKIELTNQLFCDTFGIPAPPEAMIGADCSDSAEQSKYLFKNPEKFVVDIRRIINEKKPVFNDELELLDGRYLERDYIPTFLHNIYSGHLWKYRDVTERKLAEIELKKISQAVEQSPIMTLITDIEGKIQYANSAILKVTGFSKEELLGKKPSILSSHEMSNQDYKELWLSITSGKEWKGDFHNKKKNGELYWAGALIAPIINSKGKITHYVSVEEDITHRKMIEKELIELNESLELKVEERTHLLSESEQKYKLVVENINEVIFQTDAEGLWLYLNPAWEKVTGFTVEESMGTLFLNYVHPDDRQRNTELFEPLILRKKEYCRHEIRYLTKDGNFRWIEVFARLGLNDSDEIIGTYGTLQDITERKQVEDDLHESREKYRGLSEASFEAIFFSDKGICIEQNLAAEKMFGYSTEEALGRYGTDWIVPEDRDKVMRNMISGNEKPYEATALRKDGTTFPCALMGRMMFYKGREVRVTSLNDISQQKKAEQDLLDSQEQFSLFMDYLPALVFIKDAKSKMIYANNAMEIGLGVSKWIDKPLFEVFDQETAKRILEDDKKTLQKGYQLIEESFTNLDGTLHHYQTQKFVIPQVGKEPLLGGVGLDITARKHAEDLIVQTQHNYETFFNTIDDFLFVLDEQGNIIHINDTVSKRLQFNKEELYDKSVLMVHPPERREEAGRIVGEMLAGSADFCPVPLITKSGSLIPVETRVKAGHWNGKPVIFGVSKDVSKIQLSEEKFSKAFLSNASSMAINGFDDGLFIDVNDTFVNTMGYSRDELIGKTSLECRIQVTNATF